jgi:hypothetical protein
MIHPNSEINTAGDAIGVGVFATRRIPRGTIVWTLDRLDQKLTLDRVRSLPAPYRRLLDQYGFLNERGERILCWDNGRYVNHSCSPNVLPTGWNFEVAIRDIEAGEEITNDYATLNLERRFRCCCGSPECRRIVRPSDFERHVSDWDKVARENLPLIARVPQPLWALLQYPHALRAAIEDPTRMPSLTSHRLKPALTDPLAFAANPRRVRGTRERVSAM